MNKIIERQSSIELLRLLLMFMIIVHHSIVHGLGLMGLAHEGSLPMHFSSFEQPIATITNCFCICAVNCFVLISGYFSIKFTKKKFISLILTVVFYTFLGSSLYNIFQGNIKEGIWRLMFLSHPTYWFVNAYLYLMVFAPLFNMMFDKLSPKYIKFVIATLIFISCYLGFIWHNAMNLDGYNVFQLIMMYCIGRYLAKFKQNKSKIHSFLQYVICSLLAGTLMYVLWIKGYPEKAWHLVCYNNPLLILSSIGLFQLFRGIQFKNSFINKCAKSSFAIYLIQSSLICKTYYYPYFNEVHLKYSTGGGIWLIIIVLAVGVVLFSIAFDKIQQIINKKIVNCLSSIFKSIGR